MPHFKVLLLIKGKKLEWVRIPSSGKRAAIREAKTDWRFYPVIEVIDAYRCGQREYFQLEVAPVFLLMKWGWIKPKK